MIASIVLAVGLTSVAALALLTQIASTRLSRRGTNHNEQEQR